jgi:hypothetical protein
MRTPACSHDSIVVRETPSRRAATARVRVGAAEIAHLDAGANRARNRSLHSRRSDHALTVIEPARSGRPAPLELAGQRTVDVAAGPTLRQAVNVFAAGDTSREEGLWSGWLATTVLWNADAARP